MRNRVSHLQAGQIGKISEGNAIRDAYIPAVKARQSRHRPPSISEHGRRLRVKTGIKEQRGTKRRTSAGVSVGDSRSPSYTNLSDPIRLSRSLLLSQL